MRIKSEEIFTLEQVQEAYVEEYRAVVSDRIREYFQQGGEINESFLDKVKGGAKGFLRGYGKLIKGYGDFVASMYGYNPDDEKAQAKLPPDVQPPSEEDMMQALKDGNAAETAAMLDQLQQQIDAMKQKASEQGAEDQLGGLEQYADKLDSVVDSDPSGGQQKTPDSEAVLDMIDKVQDEWDSVEKKTKDPKLKKAMDYLEKIAVAERLKTKGRIK